MPISSSFQALRARLAARRQYRRLIAEIASLTQADLIDMGAFQVDLIRAARRQVYG